MPHFKCVPCKSRLYADASPPDPDGDLCPRCGSPLQPVGDLAEIVGFRSIESPDRAMDDGPRGGYEELAARVGDLVARREAILADEQLDAERWLDDGGTFSSEAAAEAVALPAEPVTPTKDKL